MAIPRLETNMVELANLQPGVRYNFRTNDNPDNISEGTFTRFIAPSPANDGNAQYFFSNYPKHLDNLFYFSSGLFY